MTEPNAKRAKCDSTSGDFGVFGMGTMGQNLALNIAERGYRLSAYNRPDEFQVRPRTYLWKDAQSIKTDTQSQFQDIHPIFFINLVLQIWERTGCMWLRMLNLLHQAEDFIRLSFGACVFKWLKTHGIASSICYVFLPIAQIYEKLCIGHFTIDYHVLRHLNSLFINERQHFLAMTSQSYIKLLFFGFSVKRPQTCSG